MTPEQMQQVADLTKLELVCDLAAEVEPGGVIPEEDHARLLAALEQWRERLAAKVAASVSDASEEDDEE